MSGNLDTTNACAQGQELHPLLDSVLTMVEAMTRKLNGNHQGLILHQTMVWQSGEEEDPVRKTEHVVRADSRAVHRVTFKGKGDLSWENWWEVRYEVAESWALVFASKRRIGGC